MPRKITLNAVSSAPVLANDGNAYDADLERRWSSVRAGLLSALESLESASEQESSSAGVSQPVSKSVKKRKRVEPNEWLRMYSDVATLFSAQDALKKRRMYDRAREFLRAYVERQLRALRKTLGGEGLLLLKEYKRRWDMSVRFVAFMKRILLQMHTYWMPSNCNSLKEDPVRPVDRLLMFFWREELLANLPEVTAIVFAMIDDDRSGKPIEYGPVKDVIDTLVILGAADAPLRQASKSSSFSAIDAEDSVESLHLYLQVFEDEFLQRTAAFYALEAEQMMRGSCVSAFMQSVVARLDEEIARGERLLHKDSMSRLRSTVEEKLVGAHMAYLQQEADVMLRDGREQDLTMAFKLLERLTGGLGPIRDSLTRYVVDEGLEILRNRSSVLARKEDVKKSLVVVEDLISLHRSRTEMINRCFGGAQIFFMGLSDAFQKFMNKSVGALTMPEILAYYIDCVLRKPRLFLADTSRHATFPRTSPEGNKNAQPPLMSKADILPSNVGPPRMIDYSTGDPLAGLHSPVVQQMDRAVRLFMYLDDKDMFHETYRRLLAKRLLSEHDDELEQEFIAKLKHEMGPAYTSKLQGMFQDVSVSTEERYKFRRYCESQPELFSHENVLNIGFSIHILNALYWPSFQPDELRIPRPLAFWEQEFEQRYMQNKEHRKVTWIHSQSTNLVTARFGTEYTLVVSTFQACVLLQFNDRNERTLSELSKTLNVQPASLARYLQPLVASKKNRILTCHGDIEKLPKESPGYGNDEGSAENREACNVTERASSVPAAGTTQNSALTNANMQGDGATQNNTPLDAAVNAAVSPENNAVGITIDSIFGIEAVDEQTQPEMISAAPETSSTPNEGNLDSDVVEVISVNVTSNENAGTISVNGDEVGGIEHADEDIVDDIYGDDDYPDFDPVVPPIGAPRDFPTLTMAAFIAAETQPADRGPPGSSHYSVSGVANPDEFLSSFGPGNGQQTPGQVSLQPADGGSAVPCNTQNNTVSPVFEETTGSCTNSAANTDVDREKARTNASDCGAVSHISVNDNDNVGAISDVGEDDNDDDDDDDDNSTNGDSCADSLRESDRPQPISAENFSRSEACHSQNDDLEVSDPACKIIYRLRQNFSAKSIRVVYPAVISRVTSREAAKARQSVVMDRNSVLDAALVRTMKQRKSLPHNQLIAEVISQMSSSFKPDVPLLKNRIELLIEREFIERSPTDATVYNYCA